MSKLTIAALAFVLLAAVTAVRADCPADGDGGDRELNALKNRTDRPAKPTAMDVGQLLELEGPATRAPRARWTAAQRRVIAGVEGAGVVVTGYLLGAKQEGPESANCHGADHRDRSARRGPLAVALNRASSARGAARAYGRAFFARSEGGVRTTTHDAGGIMATIEQPTLDAKAPQAHEAAEIASLRIQLQAAHERIAELCDRSGAEYLVRRDLELASWLATVAATHPQLHDPTAPLAWPAAARAQLEGLISKYRGGDLPSGQPPRAEQLRIAAAIHDLCEAHGCGVESTAAEIADAIILDDDREWRRRHMVEVH